MYKYLLLFIVFAFSCNQSRLMDINENAKDSVQYYFSLSKEKEYTYEKQLFYLKKAERVSKKTDTLYLKILAKKSFLYYKNKEKDSSKLMDMLLLRESLRLKDFKYMGKANFNLADFLYKRGRYDSAYYYYARSKENFLKISDSLEIGKKLLSMATIEKEFANYHASQETAIEALQYLLKSTENKYIASTYNILGTTYRKLNHYDKAIEMYKEAIELAVEEKTELKFKNNLGATYIDKEEYQKAIDLLLATINTLADTDKIRKARVIDNLAYARWRSGIQIGILNDYKVALDIRKEKKDTKGLIASYTHLIEYYIKEKEISKALTAINEGVRIAKSIKMPKAELDILKLKMEVLKQDINARDRYIILSDSLEKVRLQVNNEFAEIKYQNKKEREKYLIEKEKNAREKLQKRMMVLLGIIILITAVFVIYYLYYKHKKEKIEISYNTEKRIAKKLHDELANDIYNVMISLEKESELDTDISNNLLDRIESIYKRTRDISHENNTINTEIGFIDEIKELLGGYATSETNVIINGVDSLKWENIEKHKKIILYRILQELMTNMKKHSKASLVVVTVNQRKRNVEVKYVDNGIGVEVSDIKNRNGWQNVENRIESINGKITFESQPGKGIKVGIAFPS